MADAVDQIVELWRRERPDRADALWPMGLIGRVQRLNRVLERELKEYFAGHGLELWETDVLLTLRRSGPPYALTPGALLKAVMVTSGAMTNRLDRLEANGMIERRPGTGDRRSVLVHLTDRARTLLDEVFDGHLANEARQFAALTADERTQLADLLRKLLTSHGDTSIT
ncbi:MarR family winged helix-turn-helix transcriptional regulator [Pseudonocardia acaciae]|uniref:MarR family winged helix-turn-helix transcriptional regulator n=1 Tax=Pseudonocardia acaciae TaxID=551276 RepID=UPI00048B641E|nr:MarR family transcriptional regulator [Pseudonocardia acaciae]